MISTLMQPIVNQNDLFVDNNNQPLVQGRLDFLDPVSNNYIDVYSYSEDEYTILTNPIILDVYGRAEQSVFSDRLTYCRLYAFRGYDEHNQPIYEFVRDWYAGHNAQSEISDTVYGIEGLRDLDPAYNKNVMVVGYHNEHDCGPRNYYWDENSTLDVDNIYVVGSDHSSTGRWILNFDGEYLPSTFAGVYPGKVANINALLSYVEVINGKKTAPGVWFVPGNYSVETNLQTTKRVLLDAGTSFSCQYFYCGNLKVIGEPQSSICDFDFYDPQQEAHSSWFRTMAGYLTCGAKKYIFDAKDNFLNHALQNANYVLQNKIIEGQTRLPVIYSGDNCRITFNNCVINAERIFNSTDQLAFSYTEIHDHWWVNPSEIDFYSKVSARKAGLNSLVIDNFTNITAFVNAMGANGASTLDLAGREIYRLDLPASVNELRNAHVTNHANIAANGRNITIRNCQLDYAGITSNQLYVYDSRIYFINEPSVNAAWFNNSEIIASAKFTAKPNQYIFEDCKVDVSFSRVTDNTSRDSYLGFTRCNFENRIIESKNLVMKNCDCDGCTIKIYPYKDNNVYKMYCNLVGNTFNSSVPVEFTKLDVINGSSQDYVYNIQVSWTIRDNHFMGNSEGLRCRYWQHRTGSNYEKTFIATNRSVMNIDYEGNTGNCPGTDMRGVAITNNQGYKKETVSNGSNSMDLYKYSGANKRVMPTGDNGYWWQQSVNGPNTLIKYYNNVTKPYNSLTYDMFIHTNWFPYPAAHDDPVNNGDFFRMAILSYGDYIRIVQRGDGDINQGVFARVI